MPSTIWLICALGQYRPCPKANSLDETLVWLRDNEPKFGMVDSGTLIKLADMGSLSIPKQKIPRKGKKAWTAAVKWVCMHDPKDMEEVDADALKALCSIAEIDMLLPKYLKKDISTFWMKSLVGSVTTTLIMPYHLTRLIPTLWQP
ncbi:hypothetical protein ACA910_019988 [Epithemia clementina (nom. ined.)]